MEQLDLFENETKAVRYLTPKECVQRGYALFEADALRSLMIPVDKNGNITKDHPPIKTSVQQQWKIVFREEDEKVSGRR
jgi:hypothetical protein